jgi:5,10-methylene-tetrahydrofolate dehydrogenase/methenyl tetrahydrofolate cyclohydrolase
MGMLVSVAGTRGVHACRLHGNSAPQQHPYGRCEAVVLSRSDIVGKPMALLLLHANATVTICHSKSRFAGIRRADILVAAIGRAGFVRADWIRLQRRRD